MRAPGDWEIVAVYAHDASFPEFLSRAARSNVTAVRCDLTDSQQIRDMVEHHGRQWDCCLYLSGWVDIPGSVKHPGQDLIVNTGSLLNLLDELRTDRFIYMSSGAVYEGLSGEVHPGLPLNPTLPYAISKLASEQYVQCYCERLRTIDSFVLIRFFGAYGPYEATHKIYGRLIRSFALDGKNSYTVYGDGSNLIDAMYIDDAIDALQRIVTADRRNEIIDLAAGHPLPIEVLVRKVASILGGTSVHLDKQGIAHEKNLFWGSTKMMREHYGFEPKVTLDEGVRKFLTFLTAARERELFRVGTQKN